MIRQSLFKWLFYDPPYLCSLSYFYIEKGEKLSFEYTRNEKKYSITHLDQAVKNSKFYVQKNSFICEFFFSDCCSLNQSILAPFLLGQKKIFDKSKNSLIQCSTVHLNASLLIHVPLSNSPSIDEMFTNHIFSFHSTYLKLDHSRWKF